MKFQISKAKEYAILYLRETKNAQEIADELELQLSTVEEFLLAHPPEKNKRPTDSEIAFQRHRKGNTVLATIMTPEGSAIGDNFRKG